MNEVIIMRGPSGAGKSSYIMNELVPTNLIVSADHFFLKTGPDDEEFYDFNPANLGRAHAACMCNYLKGLAAGRKRIVVDNTNIHLWEFEHYIEAAQLAGYTLRIVQFVPTTIEGLRSCIRRNIHRVPAEVIARMFIDFEAYSGDIHSEDIPL